MGSVRRTMTKEGIEFTKKEWIPALRSGKYKQGRGNLHKSDETYCCLGVACDLLKDKLNLTIELTEDYRYFYDECFAMLPPKVQRYLDLGQLHGTLANLNDRGMSFIEIADYLEGKIAEAEEHVTVLD